jgi:transcription-repair coupling factor (superfamily II helicase)
LPQEAVAALPEKKGECRIELDGDAYLPDDYVEMPAERVAIYRRLAEAKTLSDIEMVQEELIDRFGRLPEAAENLMGLVSLKLLGTKLGLRSLQIAPRQVLGIFSENGHPQKGEPLKQWIGSMVQRAAAPFEFVQWPGFGIRLPIPKPQQPLPLTLKFLRSFFEEEQSGEAKTK